MKREMPVRHWPTLPETKIIDQLLADSPARVAQMLANQPPSAAAYLPSRIERISDLQAAIKDCRGCPLHEQGCAPVFGAPACGDHHEVAVARDTRFSSLTVVVAEQPELPDETANPFAGEAGQLMRRLLVAAGFDLEQVYLTYAVKHPKLAAHPTGDRTCDRDSAAPDPAKQINELVRKQVRIAAREVAACRSWLAAELQLLKPARIICLGSAAALAVLGRKVRLSEERGRWQASRWADATLVTENPLTILAMTEERERAAAVANLAQELNLPQ
jgi:DNA polymerase